MAQDSLYDEIHLHQEHSNLKGTPLLFFFVSGNPGLIEYYRDYLSYLYDLVCQQHPNINLHIYGTSLLGFEVTGTKRDEPFTHDGPYLLKDQISHLNAKFHRIAMKISSDSTSLRSDGALPVIIAGHSVGAWLSLELAFQHLSPADPKSTFPFEIKAVIPLFPTIYDLALSPRGRIGAPLLQIPGLIGFLHLLAALITLLPDTLLEPLVALCTSMPVRGAHVTTAFLRSKGGVSQALHLAKDELAVIKSEGESSWSEEFWTGGVKGVETGGQNGGRKAPRLFFYWGESDGYVAPATRERVIATRGDGNGTPGKAMMVVDEHGTNHAFCVDAKGNRLVAEQTAAFMNSALTAS